MAQHSPNPARRDRVTHRARGTLSRFAVLFAVISLPVTACRQPASDELADGSDALQTPLISESVDDVDDDVNEWFTDVTAATGVDFSFRSGRSADEYAILESLGGGVAAFDYDLDGAIDLMFAGGGELADRRISGAACGLFRNLGDFDFAAVTTAAGCEAANHYNHGIFPADFDGDGFPDLAISGFGGVQLFRNQGDGTFQRFDTWQTHSSHPWSTSLAWADYDADGHLDCYVTHYVDWSWDNHPRCSGPPGVPREVCPPREFRGISDAIYFGDGQGGFRRQDQQVGLAAEGKGLGVVAADLDLDGSIDLYVANDTTDNFFYINDGHGRFQERALLAGVSGDPTGVNTGSMGVAVGDFDGDGLPDIWVANFERELFALYRNDGQNLFSHVSRRAGIGGVEGLYVGFGTVMVDIDFDGHRDLVVANGHVSYHSSQTPFRQLPLLLHNQGDGRFERASPGGYFAQSHSGRGLIHADLNNDGSWDLVVSHLEEPVAILRGSPVPHDRWALVRLVGSVANRDAVGATLHYSHPDGEQLELICGGGSYLSHSDRRVRLLVTDPQHRPETVEVRWPSGSRESFPYPADATSVTWVEGQAESVAAAGESR